MTPLSLFYLIIIDIIFMIYALVSTIIFLISFTKIDVREFIDHYVFEQLFNLNRTGIVGYRRLRTLSQLFFETIPQISLQLRILWQIKWANVENNFSINISTIYWSIA
eukprot:398258_1